MTNKVLVKLYVPIMGEQYELWIPLNKRIYNVITILTKAVYEFSGGNYNPTKLPSLYNRLTAQIYDINLSVKEANIKNGTELILL